MSLLKPFAFLAALALLASTAMLQVLRADDAPAAPATKDAADDALTLDLGGNKSMKLVLIHSGKFIMGSPKDEDGHNEDEPQHKVTISKPFYIGVYDVTQEQYEAVMGKNPSTNVKGPTNPVDSASWDQAVEFCKKLSAKTGKTVRLPMEAQWEYACWAGTTTRYYFGDAPDYENFGDYAWYHGNSNHPDEEKGRPVLKYDPEGNAGDKTHPVGEKKPNAWGLYDMCGNVWQWCSDYYDYEAYSKSAATDPTGPAQGTERVLRGGSWHNMTRYCRSAVRFKRPATDQLPNYGFRVVVDVN